MPIRILKFSHSDDAGNSQIQQPETAQPPEDHLNLLLFGKSLSSVLRKF